jgi:hypothetical protein
VLTDKLHIDAILYTNNYLQPWLYPLAITALAVIGLVRLGARGYRWHFVYVLSYFLGVYLTHCLISTWDLNHAGRYALQSLVPVAFAAAFGLDWLIERNAQWQPAGAWQRPALWVGMAGFALATVPPSLTLFRQDDADAQQEYAFLRSLARQGIPEPGSLVVEAYPPNPLNSDGPRVCSIDGMPRFRFFGQRVRGTHLVPAVTPVTELRPHEGSVYWYEGMPCFWMRRDGEPISPSCSAGRNEGEWTVVARQKIDGRMHDRSNCMASPDAVVTLYRLVRPRGSGEGGTS